jgi:hypothetical protein
MPKYVVSYEEIVFWLRGLALLGCAEHRRKMMIMEELICLTRSSLETICVPLVSGAA